MKEKWRIAIGQLAVIDGDKEANLLKVENAIKEASLGLADMLVLPELVLTGSVERDRMMRIAEPRNGSSLMRIQSMVRERPIHVVYSFPEYVSEDEIYITTCLLGRNGEPLAYYRKAHLFTEERMVFTRGNEFVEIDVDGVRFGFLTCYDIEFPEPARIYGMRGIEILVVNSANMEPYGELHRTFIKARALENQCFVIYSNRVGANDVYKYVGQSAVIGPDGKILLDFKDDSEQVRFVDISIEQIRKSKSVFNYMEDRHVRLYESFLKQ